MKKSLIILLSIIYIFISCDYATDKNALTKKQDETSNLVHYAENFKIADLANECHMSETHFRRVFQQRMNMTPVEYVNFVRVKKACELIDKTNISMEEVAEKVGFMTPSTFNRNFRRIIGTSPYQWKKRPDNHEGKLLEYKISALKGW